MSTWKLFGRGAFGRPYFMTIMAPTRISATALRELAGRAMASHSARPALEGISHADTGVWINSADFRGDEAATIVAMILGQAITARPDWHIACHQDGTDRSWGDPFEATSRPLPIRRK